MSENENEGNVIHCKLMGMGHDHLCSNFSEKKCMLCQLRNRYNDTYGLIVNNIEINYAKEPCVDGLIRVLTPKNGLSKQHKEHVKSKLVELYSIRELIAEIDD